MKTGKIKSFTLIEVVLAMMLAAIVIGMAYTAFTIFSRLYDGYHHKNSAHADVRFLKQMMEGDMQKASLVTIGDGKLNFADSSGVVAISYIPGDDFLIRRHSSLPDTIRLKTLIMQAFYENNQVTKGVIDHLLFRFSYEQKEVTVLVEKMYTSKELINDENSLWKK